MTGNDPHADAFLEMFRRGDEMAVAWRPPDEILVLLDEAFGELPERLVPQQWPKGGKYERPVLAHWRCVDGGEPIRADTWTVELYDEMAERFWGMLEWWDDRWVRVNSSSEVRHATVDWEGRRIGS